MEERKRKYLERLYGFLEQTKETKTYNQKRMDLLVISISGAGIYLVFEILKFIHDPDTSIIVNEFPFKLSGLLFCIAIIISFISQWTGYLANKNEEDWIECEIDKTNCELEQKEFTNICKQEAIDQEVKHYNKWTAWLNFAGIVLMIIGMIILMILSALAF